MADFLKWNRPDEPGLQDPNILLDPLTYVGGGVGGLLNKLAARTAAKTGGRILQHGAILKGGKPISQTMEGRIENLRKIGRNIQSTYNEQPMQATWQRVQDALKRMGWE
jgi:hypothetical protein